MDFLGLALLLLAGFVVGVGLLAAYTARTLTRPPRRGYAFALARNIPSDPAELRFVDPSGAERVGVPFESYSFRSRGLDLPVWDMSGCNPGGPILIVTHGWGDSRIVSLCRAPALLRHARRVILWDLPGHGDAPGRSSLGRHEAVDLAALVELLRVDDASIVLYGHSLGAGVAIEAAGRGGPRGRGGGGGNGGAHPGASRVAGVIAEAPYARSHTPARNVMRFANLPFRLNLPLALALIRPGFDRGQQAADLRVPLLVLHGDADLICPLTDAREIATAGKGRLVVIPGAGHVDIYTDPRFAATAEDAVATFLKEIFAPAHRSEAH